MATQAILLLQLIDIPQAYPAGTIIEVLPIERMNLLGGGDMSTFFPIMAITNQYSFEELRAMKVVKAINFSAWKGIPDGISDDTIAARRAVCLNGLQALRNSSKPVIILPQEIIPPKFHKVVNIDNAGMLYNTGMLANPPLSELSDPNPDCSAGIPAPEPEPEPVYEPIPEPEPIPIPED